MRTVVGLYNTMEDAQCAVQALHNANFGREDINFIARDINGDFKRHFDTAQGEGQDLSNGTAAGAGIGAVLGGLGGLLVGLGLLAIPGIGPVLAAGPIATTLLGAGAGAVTGGVVGALVDLGIPEEHAKMYAEGIRRGGTLVTVRTPDDRSDEAVQLLESCNPIDIRSQMKNWQTTEGQDLNKNVQPMDTNQMETMETHRMENIPVTGDQGMDTPVIKEDVQHTGTEDFQRFDQNFRSHFNTTYASQGLNYNEFSPAYQYGYNLARDNRFSSYDWNSIEPEARAAWERRYGQSTWDRVRNAVEYAWETTRG